MPVRSLRSMATATAIRYVKVLEDLGAMPYALVRPILLRIDNPQKLHSLELASPHLAEEDQEIWMDFIKRDIPRWDTYSLPEQSNNWYNIYCDLREQTDRSLDADAEIMKKAIDGINDKRALLTPQIIPQNKSHRMAHARPTSKQRSAARDRSLGGRNIGGPLPRESSGWGKKKPNIFQPARRNTALTIPTKALNTRASQVPRAPRALVEEHQESRRPKPTIAAPKHLPPALQHPLLAQNEAKLRALTGNPARADAKPDLKRRATSPPPASSSSSAPSAPFPPQSSGLPSSGPVMRRRPPPSIFMPPKRRRM